MNWKLCVVTPLIALCIGAVAAGQTQKYRRRVTVPTIPRASARPGAAPEQTEPKPESPKVTLKRELIRSPHALAQPYYRVYAVNESSTNVTVTVKIYGQNASGKPFSQVVSHSISPGDQVAVGNVPFIGSALKKFFKITSVTEGGSGSGEIKPPDYGEFLRQRREAQAKPGQKPASKEKPEANGQPEQKDAPFYFGPYPPSRFPPQAPRR